ncbi:metal-dependent hydrolase [Rathayibacter sp. ZW T2_19]|uniref:Metal-dependent hydrolase n=1 Tax=Rathayibacter rubneri TaxID=2950106 RepID=A0A9X2DZF5_9MICO|nr:metal-dependent hydrolase [Rathayibacter rubneri]MCM6763493.1 metal-dependent hydrolase [Rathayibacter rubneri]
MIHSDTLVSYPAGATSSEGAIVHLDVREDGRWVVVLDETAAHPIDPTWPDQGADVGALVAEGLRYRILDSRIAAWDGTALHLGDRLPVRLGTEGWSFVVAHLVADASALAEGQRVRVEIDPAERLSLSRGHTACHLASLALNAALADFWSKPVRTDSLGSADFDQAAIASSLIRPSGSTDVYRLGKSLRRSGFDTARLQEALPELTERIDELLAEWIGSDADVRIERDDASLSARRTWRCDLPAGEASIPCGGTHVTRLSELGSVTVELAIDPIEATLTMETDAA